MPLIPFELIMLVLGGSALLLKSARAFLAVIIIGATIWVAGLLFAPVAQALGFPQRSWYELAVDITGKGPTKTPTPRATFLPRLTREPTITLRPTRTLRPTWTPEATVTLLPSYTPVAPAATLTPAATQTPWIIVVTATPSTKWECVGGNFFCREVPL